MREDEEGREGGEDAGWVLKEQGGDRGKQAFLQGRREQKNNKAKNYILLTDKNDEEDDDDKKKRQDVGNP